MSLTLHKHSGAMHDVMAHVSSSKHLLFIRNECLTFVQLNHEIEDSDFLSKSDRHIFVTTNPNIQLCIQSHTLYRNLFIEA